ncbi:MAG: hypothetical protein E7640_01070 [Ruminococcaceae bacterium]|nr:hypothetical protein [Oscillospiraceae bacterium]
MFPYTSKTGFCAHSQNFCVRARHLAPTRRTYGICARGFRHRRLREFERWRRFCLPIGFGKRLLRRPRRSPAFEHGFCLAPARRIWDLMHCQSTAPNRISADTPLRTSPLLRRHPDPVCRGGRECFAAPLPHRSSIPTATPPTPLFAPNGELSSDGSEMRERSMR